MAKHEKEGPGKLTGQSPHEEFRNPYNMGIDRQFEAENETKTLRSPTDTPAGMGIEMDHHYDSYWTGEKK